MQFHQSVGGKTEINMRRVGSNFELICLKTNDRFVNVEPNQKIMLIIFPSYERTSCTLNLSKWRMRSETKKIEKNKSWFLYYTCPFRYQYNAATYFLWQYFSISGTQWMKVSRMSCSRLVHQSKQTMYIFFSCMNMFNFHFKNYQLVLKSVCKWWFGNYFSFLAGGKPKYLPR